MLRMAVGHAKCLDADCAARGAAASCRDQLGGAPPVGLLLFTGVGYDHNAILDVIEDVFPGVPLVGATSAGERSAAAGVSDESVLLVAFAGDGIGCLTGVARDFAAPGADPRRQAREAFEAVRGGLPGEVALGLAFPDGGRGGAQEFGQELAAAIGPKALLFGGLAGRHLADRRPLRQFFGREICIHAAPFLLLTGDIPVAFRLSRGWRPVGGLSRVTGVEGTVVHRIGEGTALDFYRHYLGPHAEPATELPLAIACEKHKDFILRAPAFYSEGDGSIQFPAGVPEGAMVQLAQADRPEMLADIREMAKSLGKEAAFGFTPAGALLFSCSTRKDILGTKAEEEITQLAAALPPGTPLAGFSCHGELSAAAPGLPLHLQSGSLVTVVLGGEPARAALPLGDGLPGPAGEVESLEREIRSLSRALARANASRERLEAQKDRSQALMRVINREINEARLEIQRKNELLRQALALAEEVQRNLLPQAAPGLPGFDIAGLSLYSDETGGDYFDFIHEPNEDKNRFGVIIGDVTGHGIAAALLMTTARAFLRMRSFQPGSLAAVIDDVNKLLCADLADSGRFMTLFYLAIDTEKKRLHWVRAGHDPIILYDAATGLAQDIPDKGGPPLGIVTEARYAENSAEGMKPGQVALLATDGLWEARNAAGEMFGKDRVRALLGRHHGEPAAALVDAVLAGLREFLGDAQPEDDVTLVAIKVLPDEEGTA
ncbi:SpoIIE family protein phosphatase [Solidesulfovibrio sp.]|uniref:SpoIIE family protein phosphatase n=1 Tax=Solidesulfovibrio sp. TaxID=2910990 RepID=UPI002B1EB053|nr:SpoIIE family protein phosphatase [Solidesulfovibrio sp.]MEA4858600.1 SpoIIE family protein phosphatase [Solidesulfovibrio sp.]